MTLAKAVRSSDIADAASMNSRNILLFLRALAQNPSTVGAIAPSSPSLADLITSEINAASGRVLELGPGTGVFTEALLARGIREADLTLIEYGSDFMRLLQLKYPRARVLWMDAAWIVSHDLFKEQPLGAVISGIPLLNLSAKKVVAILTGVFSNLRDGGAMYQFTYGMRCPISRSHLDRLGLKATCLGRVLMNVPPATVYKITRRRPCKLNRL